GVEGHATRRSAAKPGCGLDSGGGSPIPRRRRPTTHELQAQSFEHCFAPDPGGSVGSTDVMTVPGGVAGGGAAAAGGAVVVIVPPPPAPGTIVPIPEPAGCEP